jgi:hypothetical protein
VESLVTSVDKVRKRSLAYYLAIEETGIGRIDIAISLPIVHLRG